MQAPVEALGQAAYERLCQWLESPTMRARQVRRLAALAAASVHRRARPREHAS